MKLGFKGNVGDNWKVNLRVGVFVGCFDGDRVGDAVVGFVVGCITSWRNVNNKNNTSIVSAIETKLRGLQLIPNNYALTDAVVGFEVGCMSNVKKRIHVSAIESRSIKHQWFFNRMCIYRRGWFGCRRIRWFRLKRNNEIILGTNKWNKKIVQFRLTKHSRSGCL